MPHTRFPGQLGSSFDIVGGSAHETLMWSEKKCIFLPSAVGCGDICSSAVPRHAHSSSDNSMAKLSIPLLPECTRHGEVTAPEQYCCSSFWRTYSTTPQFSSMIWLAMRSSRNILRTHVIRKPLSTFSVGERILFLQAAYTVCV